MSLSFYLEHIQPVSVFSGNITHNLSEMWRRAGVHHALYDSQGLLARDILPDLRRGLHRMEDNPEVYRVFDSPNGWGVYENALPWLREVVAACEENPDATIRVSK